jgi:hypothetical protein
MEVAVSGEAPIDQRSSAPAALWLVAVPAGFGDLAYGLAGPAHDDDRGGMDLDPAADRWFRA